MNNEIKEIIEFLKPIENRTCATLGNAKCKLLLDYITNLQEENEKLNDIIETLKETNKLLIHQKYKLQYELDKLDESRDKAIEYIEDIWKDTENKNIYSIIGIGLIRAKLLNILQGEDKDK